MLIGHLGMEVRTESHVSHMKGESNTKDKKEED